MKVGDQEFTDMGSYVNTRVTVRACGVPVEIIDRRATTEEAVWFLLMEVRALREVLDAAMNREGAY